MAIKIRCTRCSRRISIDEAFAGGVCRCPYCKTINHVPDAFAVDFAQQRPDAPPTGVRSGPRVAMRADAASETGEIPVADRIVFQGVATLILIAMLIAVIVVGAMLVFSADGGGNGGGNGAITNGNGGNGRVVPPPSGPANPFVTGPTRTLAGVPFKTPVAYCIDAGGSMRSVFYYAVRMTAASVESLSVDDGFHVIVAEEDGPRMMPPNAIGPTDREDIERFAGDILPGGEGDTIAALSEAVDGLPETIILFARKTVDAPLIVARANRRGIVIFTVSLNGNEVINESLAALAEQTGGESLSFGGGQLQRWLEEAD